MPSSAQGGTRPPGDLTIDLSDLLVDIGQSARSRKTAGEAKSYAERLFDYSTIDRLDAKSARTALVEPARREAVTFEDAALDVILRETDCYPFFLQAWGAQVWEITPSSPILAEHANLASSAATAALDTGFFKVRFDRLTDRQQEYVRAMAEFGPSPARSTAVANVLKLTVKQAAPIRDEVIKKGIAYSPKRGLVAFTVPKIPSFRTCSGGVTVRVVDQPTRSCGAERKGSRNKRHIVVRIS